MDSDKDSSEDESMDENENITDDEDFMELALLVTFPRNKKKFRKRPDHFSKWNNQEFYDRFRLSKTTVKYVLGLIEEKISSPTTR